MSDLHAALHAADMAVLDALATDPAMSKAEMVGIAVRAAAPLIREAERDAARAEAERLTIEIGKVVDSRERLRVEMGQKVIDAHREAALAQAEVAALRERLASEIREAEVARKHARVLADLRGKVEALHDKQHFPWLPKRGTTDCGCPVGAVLALIEEAENE